jgi:hypothetical protein
MAPKAVPMMTPMARSTMLPCIANALNSLSTVFASFGTVFGHLPTKERFTRQTSQNAKKSGRLRSRPISMTNLFATSSDEREDSNG